MRGRWNWLGRLLLRKRRGGQGRGIRSLRMSVREGERGVLDLWGDLSAVAAPALASLRVVRSLILDLWARLAAAPAELSLSGFQASMGLD